MEKFPDVVGDFYLSFCRGVDAIFLVEMAGNVVGVFANGKVNVRIREEKYRLHLYCSFTLLVCLCVPKVKGSMIALHNY